MGPPAMEPAAIFWPKESRGRLARITGRMSGQERFHRSFAEASHRSRVSLRAHPHGGALVSVDDGVGERDGIGRGRQLAGGLRRVEEVRQMDRQFAKAALSRERSASLCGALVCASTP